MDYYCTPIPIGRGTECTNLHIREGRKFVIFICVPAVKTGENILAVCPDAWEKESMWK